MLSKLGLWGATNACKSVRPRFGRISTAACSALSRRSQSTTSSHEESAPPNLIKDVKRQLDNAATLTADRDLDIHQSDFLSSSYPRDRLQGLIKRRAQENLSNQNVLQRDQDHSDTSIILFPGQGAQFVGMAKELLDVPNVKDMFDRASHVLKYDLLDVCLKGPQSKLDKTLYCQPAVVVTSLAAVEKLHMDKPEAVERCRAAAGFSVGEIAALIFSGTLSFDDGVSLVKIRAEAMQHCSDMAPSGMMAIFFGPKKDLTLACAAAKKWTEDNKGIRDPVCQVANYLFEGSKVLAGHKECLQFIEENKRDFGIRACKHIRVSGAFHTSLMDPAREVISEALERVQLSDPKIPVHSCYDEKVYKSAECVKKYLPRQVVRPVKWEQAMHRMFKYKEQDFMPWVYECGPGRSLSGILNKVNGKAGRRTRAVAV